MEFNNTQAIYLQIADYVCDKIQLKEWKEDEKIPSVRELAVMLEVNPNTVMRTFEYLQQQEIVYTKRGMGLYVAKDSAKKIKASRKQQFLTEELPLLFRKMNMLDIAPDELQARFDEFKKNMDNH
ncbi:GntR family transcriptional regulator [Mucilaginibacter sp. HMF5004]|uniref:GntR family transcriptional regulator n=1 Tax=Mucilaginibacter rivuli TaxID=2857527 RepID=UPI001C5CE4F3|nr:GntR family transcriptional regulator [Mucilaginibacter rivuli]MBW4891710.1 GntR family transcriptional regulator [Mucilaginibacter rivuli]